MSIFKKAKTFLAKLQNLPEGWKKVILWGIVVILALPMLFFWFRAAKNNLSEIQEAVKAINIPAVEISDAPNLLPLNLPEEAQAENEENINENGISIQEARELVKKLPEVEKWLSSFLNNDGTLNSAKGTPVIDFDHRDENTYFIHAYHVLQGEQKIFKWYDVDIKTGNIKTEL